MRRSALVICFSLIASPIWALSCLPPDAVFLYQDIRNSDADYYLVKGTVTLTEPARQPEPSDTKRSEALTRAVVTGQGLTRSGFTRPVERPITIRATCIGPWCGTPQVLSSEPHILALKIERDALVLTRGPCGGTAIMWSEDQENRLLDCHRTGDCRQGGAVQ